MTTLQCYCVSSLADWSACLYVLSLRSVILQFWDPQSHDAWVLPWGVWSALSRPWGGCSPRYFSQTFLWGSGWSFCPDYLVGHITQHHLFVKSHVPLFNGIHAILHWNKCTMVKYSLKMWLTFKFFPNKFNKVHSLYLSSALLRSSPITNCFFGVQICSAQIV